MEWINFQRPQRYLDGEWNVVKKPDHKGIKVCICYPDLYEVGMSNLGLRIIYGLLNANSGIVCERSFMPGDDLRARLINEKVKLFSLETRSPLSAFDVVGFNLSCEFTFTNFLDMLFLGGIPLKSAERKDLIVIGGAAGNPEVLWEFVDVFLIGEFEAVSEDFTRVLRQEKSKDARLRSLSEIEGFYVPSFYEVDSRNGFYSVERKYKRAKIPLKKVYVRDLNTSFYPVEWLTPRSRIVHDRIQIEVARGCPNKCYFCQARCMYYPYRERNVDNVIKLAKETYKNSGYEGISLLSLSLSDYSRLDDLINVLIEEFAGKNVGLSLPSLRVDDFINWAPRRLAALKKLSLTLAIEAAADSLREKVNKHIDIAKLFEAVKIFPSLGIRHVKLYFMYGLPGESVDDVLAIADFIRDLKKTAKINFNISVNAFIPKPFSAFEKEAFNIDSLSKRRKIILNSARGLKGVKIDIPHFKKSVLEAVISRAGRDFSRVIFSAYEKGARGGELDDDSWRIWEEAMFEHKFDYKAYLMNKKDDLPWAHINL